MITSSRRTVVRPSITLLAASLLASSALLTASIGTLAAPPAPSVVFQDNPTCDVGDFTTLYIDVDVSYKGKWVDFSWSTSFDGGPWLDGLTVLRYDSTTLFTISKTVGSASSAQARVSVLDRDGGVLESFDSPPVDCT